MTAKTEKFVLVKTTFTSYTGKIALSRAGFERKDNLPTDLVSSGELKLIDPKRLTVFNTLRQKARIACLKYGTSFMGGYAVPVSHWPEVQATIDSVAADFKAEAQTFINNYDGLVEDWAIRHPNESDLIRNSKHTTGWLSGRFEADFMASFLQPAPGMEEATDRQIGGLAESIRGDIASAAQQALRGHKNGSQITRKMISGTLALIVEKLEALAFVDDSLQSIADAIQEHVDFLDAPKTGKLPAETQSRIAMLLMLMQDADNLPRLAELLATERQKIKAIEHQAQAEAQAEADAEQSEEPDSSDSEAKNDSLDEPQPAGDDSFEPAAPPRQEMALPDPDDYDFDDEEFVLV